MQAFPTNNINKNYLFKITIIGIALTYVILEFFYNSYSRLSRDEFWFGQHIYHYMTLIPYKDFPPYKTVLGYYLLSLPFYFAHGVLSPLFYIKDEIALLNGIFLCVVSFWGLKFFRARALFYTLILLLSTQLFFIYSADLRVDMLASWFCLFSLLAVLSKRFGFAGLLLSIGFLISQKALWYVIAIDATLILAYFYKFEINKQHIFYFNICLFAGIVTYFVFWSCISSPEVVWHSMFYEAYTQSKITYYGQYGINYWKVILQDGSLLFLLWPFTIFLSFTKLGAGEKATHHFFITCFASIILILIMLYQQAFPYNMVFLFPAFYLLYADFFVRLDNIFKSKNYFFNISQEYLLLFFGLYILAIITVGIFFDLNIQGLILLIPLVFYLYLQIVIYKVEMSRKIFFTILMSLILLTGMVLPLIREVNLSLLLDGEYQQKTTLLTHKLLGENVEYLAGIPLFYDKKQTVAGIENLIDPEVEYLYTQDASLLPILIPSLNLQPRTQQQVLNDFKNSSVKVIVENDRVAHLPASIVNFINLNYETYSGIVMIYAPVISHDEKYFNVKFSGRYLIEGKSPVSIDGRGYKSKQIVLLNVGKHISVSNEDYRLKLMPEGIVIDGVVSQKWDKLFFKPIVL